MCAYLFVCCSDRTVFGAAGAADERRRVEVVRSADAWAPRQQTLRRRANMVTSLAVSGPEDGNGYVNVNCGGRRRTADGGRWTVDGGR